MIRLHLNSTDLKLFTGKKVAERFGVLCRTIIENMIGISRNVYKTIDKPVTETDYLVLSTIRLMSERSIRVIFVGAPDGSRVVRAAVRMVAVDRN